MTAKSRKPLEAYLCFVILVLMTILMTIEVILRYIFGSSLIWAEELTRYLFIWFIFISASYAIVESAHIKLDSILFLIPKKIRPFTTLFGNVIWLGFCLMVTYLGFNYSLTLLSGAAKSAVMKIPTGIVYLGIPIGYFLMSLRLVKQIIHESKNLRREN